MTTSAFVLTKNLEDLNADERRQHMINVCESLGLDPARGLLKYEMMPRNDGSNESRLVLYATKGATDALRDIHGIDIIDLTDKVVNGAIVYTVKGKNKKGRTDIAVGAMSLEGRHGAQLANAFAAAQTKATRRLTLQFTGSGLLDESEVMDNTTSIANAPVPLSEIGGPVPPVSSAEGVDITGITVQLPPAKAAEEPVRVKNPGVGLKPITVMTAPDGKKTAEKVVEKPADPVVVEVSAAPVAEEAKPARRKRRTKAEMEASRATESQSSEQPAAAEQASSTAEGTAVQEPVVEDVSAPPQAVTAPAPAPEPKTKASKKATVPLIGNMPTADQMKVYVDRLLKYSDDILTNAGLLPTLGMGPRRKVREFMKIINAGADLNNLTVPQWDNSFRYLDQTVTEKGAKYLVELIEHNLKLSVVNAEGTNNEPTA